MTEDEGEKLTKCPMLMQRSKHLPLFGHSVTISLPNCTPMSIDGITSSSLCLIDKMVNPGFLLVRNQRDPWQVPLDFPLTSLV